MTHRSISGAVWRSNLVPKLTAYLPAASKGQAQAIFGSIVVAQKFAAGTVERDAIDQAYRETQWLLAIAATCALAPMVFIMWFIKNVDLSVDEAAEEPEERRESDSPSHTAEKIVQGPEKV